MASYPTRNATQTIPGLSEFFTQYMDTALWSSTDEEGEPLDDQYTVDDLSPQAVASMREDCQDFLTSNRRLIPEGEESQAGHDFWLTRNRHGAGFWDGDWPEGDGRALTDAAHAYGECNLYVGDDGRIYLS